MHEERGVVLGLVLSCQHLRPWNDEWERREGSGKAWKDLRALTCLHLHEFVRPTGEESSPG